MNLEIKSSKNEDVEQQLLNLRPSIALDINLSNDIEKFQNQTIRPILKFLHTSLLTIFEDDCKNQDLKAILVTPKETRDWLKLHFSKNTEFRNTISGMVLSLFTQTELFIYLQNKQEFKRRIFTMTIERIANTINP
jgi:hypothetical protein